MTVMRQDTAASGPGKRRRAEWAHRDRAGASGGGNPVITDDPSTPGDVSPPRTAAGMAGHGNGTGFEVAFPPEEHRVAHMRRITAAFLRHRSLDSLTDDAELVVSELVTNAVRHGAGPVGLRVALGVGELRIEVRDGSSIPARLRTADPADESGRGLFLVDAVA
ncbi:ATP-binding protein [Streptomyces fradiae]|uniref:ATP-binding protein n=1 Tax=Streptomyces fradiae TaxID=1906 RepID=UPI002942E767|nr:ATP-binding protein [Streptomyces fradiae]WOI63642.1 ATP-binding protein [Streptomyces fradiae]